MSIYGSGQWYKPNILPGSTNHPLGKIKLDVCFGDNDNFHREKLEFKVMDWPS
jgi:hypothetical protein